MLAAVTSPRRRRAVLALQALTATATVGYGLSTVILPSEARPNVVLDSWLYNMVLLAAAALCAARAALVAENRTAWGALAAGLALWTAGDVYWAVAIAGLDSAPFPTLADAGYLAFYPCAYVALFSLARTGFSTFLTSLRLDGLLAALGTAALGAALAFGPILAATGGSPVAIVVNLAYPLADLILLAFVAGVLTLRRWRLGGPLPLVGTGLAVFAVADTAFLFRVANDTYVEGTPLDALWPGGFVVMALAAWRPPRPSGPVRAEGWLVLAVPGAFTAISVGLLVWDHFHRLPLAAVVLAAATLAVGGLRTVLTFREVRALAESRLQARTDDLTGLGNRRLFQERAEEAMGARAGGDALAVLLVDLDDFKEINDALGHDVGDQLLRQLGPRFAAVLEETDTLARLGGDEFALLLGPGAGVARAEAVALGLRAALAAPFELLGVTVHVSASVGIALCPDHGTDASALLQRADMAMYQAKRSRTGHAIYDPGGDEHARDRLEIINELRVAIRDEELVLHYQPKLDLATGRVAGLEALVRWDHPRRGLLFPDAFLELAEHTGLMRPLTQVVLRTAIRQCRAWWDAGHEVVVAVNVSAGTLLDNGFPHRVRDLLAATGLPGGALRLEITENVLMTDPARARDTLVALRRLGVGCSVDDYGTGYASLAYLRDLPIDELKLDKSFVTILARDPRPWAIVRSTIDLAHALGLAMVAEGVESEAVCRQLAEMGCDVAQGYHISRPVPAAEATAYLAAHRPSPVPVPQYSG